jgi:hypothetical protein
MKRQVKVPGGEITVEVIGENGAHMIYVDDVLWVVTDNQVHAAVMFHMIADHITEYMNYEITD